MSNGEMIVTELGNFKYVWHLTRNSYNKEDLLYNFNTTNNSIKSTLWITSKGLFSFYIQILKSPCSFISISILDDEGKFLLQNNSPATPPTLKFERCLSEHQKYQIAYKQKLKMWGYISLDITVSIPTETMKLGVDLGNLFKAKKYVDIIFKFKDGTEIPAHKAILTSRSEVFAAMFQSKMKESKEGCVEINDIEYQIFEEMLNYIYSGKISHLDENPEKLLAVADIYGLEELKMICAEKLISNLSINTAGNVLLLADLYRLSEMNDKAIKFINSNIKEFIKSEGYNVLCKKCPELLDELYKSAAMNSTAYRQS